MSLEELRQGLGDLETAITNARTTKKENQKLTLQKQAQADQANTISSSPIGGTVPGQLAAKGVASGSLDLTKANEMLSQFGDPTKAIMWLTSQAVGETDPVERQNKLAAINKFMIPYNNIKAHEAWNESYQRANGNLTAQKEFGVLNHHLGRGGGGGQTGPNDPNNKQIYTTEENQEGTTPAEVKMDGYAPELKKFITQDDLSAGWKDPAKGFFRQQMEPEDLAAYQARQAQHINNWILTGSGDGKGNRPAIPILAKPGMEGERARVVGETMKSIGDKGTLGGYSVSNAGGVETLSPLTIPIHIPNEKILNSVQGSVTTQKSKKKSQTVNFLTPAPASNSNGLPATTGGKSLDDILSGK